ncbi:MAG: DEAD/DEAH box helicase family protein [Roseburia sp.]|nr:DEAD/DEAH box helicase family protein [Anaeroplasma bactoclasticum]MCM1196431.1 DEAD/DEAH box helicase family protein [Roseburia sp.]
MSITLAQFQLNAIKQLLECMETPTRDIILKSPTGSGKTIILTHFMDEYLKGHSKSVFIWLTPGKGDLEEQSKAKMDKYIHNAQTKLLADIMTSGFEENDSCFINWEKLTKKGNNALKDSEYTNFNEWIEKALNAGLSFKVIIDESHQNFTDKADKIIQYFKTDKIIRCSATPLKDNMAKEIEIKEEEVIAEGLIKKMLIINEDFPQRIETENQTEYLLDKALVKQQELRSKLISKNINPLIIVQLPNNSELLLDTVEKYFESKGITYDNGGLAVWLSNKHINKEHLEDNNNDAIVVIIKQAVATGWDCPRAHILVKLRENMDETFEIQTIGRIRRMPEAKHYDDDLLDSCYLYTFDSKFTQGVKNSMGKSALDAKTLFLKNEYRLFSLTKEQRTMVTDTHDPRKALTSIAKYLNQKYGLTGDKKKNKTILETKGYVFDDKIIRYTLSGKVIVLSEISEKDRLNVVSITETINTHIHGREYHNRVGRIGLEIGMEYSYMNTIIGKLFGIKFSYSEKILSLQTRELYAFVINNMDLLKQDCREAMAARLNEITLDLKYTSTKLFRIPQSTLFTYDGSLKVQELREKNVYQGYLSSAEPRSSSEKKFEIFCEEAEAVEWIYKNGDKGEEYLSIVYLDNSNYQKLFYPDYIISVRGEIWIIETKGGFTRTGASEDIDIFSGKKFDVLKNYLNKYSLKGGFVRYDKKNEVLCICTENYSDDIQSDSWNVLKEVIK